MIYVFAFAREVCALPGKACLAIADLLGEVENCSCGPIKQCFDGAAKLCTSCGKSFSGFMDQPLSTYVVVKVVLCVAALYSTLAALQEPSLGERVPGKVCLKTWLFVQAAFALLNLFFAPYLQYMVWRRVLRTSSRFPSRGVVTISPHVIHSSFRFVLLHDIPVCIYSFILLASCAWSYMGIELVDGPGCNPGGWPGKAAQSGIFLFWIALLYLGCYYWCKMDLHAAQPRADFAAPSAPPMQGFPAAGALGAPVAMPSQQGFATGSVAARVDNALAYLCSYLVPPLGIFWRFGWGWRLAVCVVLTMMGYIPGVIYACVVITCDNARSAQARALDVESPYGCHAGDYISIK